MFFTVVVVHSFKRYLLEYLSFGFIRSAFPLRRGYYACYLCSL
jgi:hypothetical protein